jgi:hypothetical protein
MHVTKRGASAALLAACAMGAAGCTTRAEPAANDPACTAPGKCPNDAPPTSDAADACERVLEGACGPQYRAFLDCAAKSATCGTDGKTDEGAVDAACSTENGAYLQCASGPAPSGIADAMVDH